MELIRGLHNLKTAHRGCVATIGNFDGLHRGHQQVLAQLRRMAAERGVPSCLITFDPLPHEYFAGEKASARLSALREKWRVLSGLGIDRVLLLSFNHAFSALTAQTFVQRVLFDGLGVQHLVVGDDFRFGHGREGDYALLQAMGQQANMQVTSTDTFVDQAARVSSTRIREALAQGDLALAEQLLGRPYCVSGRVAHGDKIGRQLGYPTLNVLHKHPRLPLAGVYAVMVELEGEGQFNAMCNVGKRPTVNGLAERLETHLFDFSKDVYGKMARVTFCQRMRDEQKFDSFEALKAALANDYAQAQQFFAQGGD